MSPYEKLEFMEAIIVRKTQSMNVDEQVVLLGGI